MRWPKEIPRPPKHLFMQLNPLFMAPAAQWLSCRLESSLVTVSITPEDLADYLRRHEEEYGAFDPTEDGVIEDQPHHGHASSDTSED